VAKGGVGIIALAKSSYEIANGALVGNLNSANAVSAILGVVTGPLNVLISSYVVIHETHAAIRTTNRIRKFDEIKHEQGELRKKQSLEFDPVLHQYMRYGSHKLKRKRRMNIARVGAAGIGTVGGVGATTATVLAALTIANAWNPVGWALGGAGLALGIGMSVYAIHRRVKKKNYREKRAAEGKPVDKAQFAAMMVAAFVDREFHDANPVQWYSVRQVLLKCRVKNIPGEKTDISPKMPDENFDVAAAIKKVASKL
jgi:hypothetical protein